MNAIITKSPMTRISGCGWFHKVKCSYLGSDTSKYVLIIQTYVWKYILSEFPSFIQIFFFVWHKMKLESNSFYHYQTHDVKSQDDKIIFLCTPSKVIFSFFITSIFYAFNRFKQFTGKNSLHHSTWNLQIRQFHHLGFLHWK